MTLQETPFLVSFISVQSGASFTSNVHKALTRIYIGRRFGNDTERLEKVFEPHTKTATKVVI